MKSENLFKTYIPSVIFVGNKPFLTKVYYKKILPDIEVVSTRKCNARIRHIINCLKSQRSNENYLLNEMVSFHYHTNKYVNSKIGLKFN